MIALRTEWYYLPANRSIDREHVAVVLPGFSEWIQTPEILVGYRGRRKRVSQGACGVSLGLLQSPPHSVHIQIEEALRMECPKCGYMMDAFEKECPRCAKMGTMSQPTPVGTATRPAVPPAQQPGVAPVPVQFAPATNATPKSPAGMSAGRIFAGVVGAIVMLIFWGSLGKGAGDSRQRLSQWRSTIRSKMACPTNRSVTSSAPRANPWLRIKCRAFRDIHPTSQLRCTCGRIPAGPT